jgi:peptide/nickel transport system permease protein
MLRKMGLIIFVVFLVVALFAPLIGSHDPQSYDGPALSAPSEEFLLGTNDLGQDIFSQLIYGARTSIFVGMTVALISTVISIGLGLLSGYNRKLNPYIMAMCDMILAIPNLLIVIIVVALTGSHLWNVILVLSFVSWPGYAKIFRSQVLSLRERDHVKAAKTYGAKQGYILRKHIFPDIFPIAVAKFINTAQFAIVAEASLSFLGLGDITEISWGMMLHYAFQSTGTFITSAWQWWVLPPTLCIMLLILSFAFLGYGLEENKSMANKKQKIRSPVQARQTRKLKKGNLPLYQEKLPSSHELLEIKDLHVAYPDHEGKKQQAAVDGVSFTIQRGEILSLIGESGSGKTTIGKSLLGMLPFARMSGSIYFRGDNLMELTGHEWRKRRWVDISIVFQNAKQSLNPVLKIGVQIDEVLKYHKGIKGNPARTRTKSLLRDVGLDESLADNYPHELSGGMCSRVGIAMALACEPDLLIADEPTSSIDTITRKKVMALLQDRVHHLNLSMLFITHDMGVVAEMADSVAVIKQGKVVEQGSVWDLFNTPKERYTKKLMRTRDARKINVSLN